MKTHILKVLPEYFQALVHPDPKQRKTVEIRKDDRGFQVGDRLVLREYNPEKGYTGEEVSMWITHILRDPPYIPEGYAALSVMEDNSWSNMLRLYRQTLENLKQFPPYPEIQSMIQDLERSCNALEQMVQTIN